MSTILTILDDAEPSLRVAGVLLFAFLFVRARVNSPPVPNPDSRRFLRRLVAACAAWAGLVAVLNEAVNPYGIYASHLFEPIVLHSRTDKMRLYREFEPAPDIVVFGSSRSFTISPAEIRRLTGRIAFNASVHGGIPRDYLAFLRYMVALRKVPRIAIVCVSVELLRSNLLQGFEPYDPLTRYDPHARSEPFSGLATLLSLQHARASLHLLATDEKGRGLPHYRFDKDGLAHFNEPRPLDEAVDSYLDGPWAPSFFDFDELDRGHMSALTEFLVMCRQHGVRVIAYLPPYQPRAEAIYQRSSRLPVLRAQLLEQLGAFEERSLISAVYDFSDIASFGGTPAMFHDAAHPTVEASNHMVAVMRPSLSAP
jgi:hypothetical protein